MGGGREEITGKKTLGAQERSLNCTILGDGGLGILTTSGVVAARVGGDTNTGVEGSAQGFYKLVEANEEDHGCRSWIVDGRLWEIGDRL